MRLVTHHRHVITKPPYLTSIRFIRLTHLLFFHLMGSRTQTLLATRKSVICDCSLYRYTYYFTILNCQCTNAQTGTRIPCMLLAPDILLRALSTVCILAFFYKFYNKLTTMLLYISLWITVSESAIAKLLQ